MAVIPNTDPQAVVKQLESQMLSLSRDPFKMALAHFLAAEPDIDAINEYSKKHPDRWARAITELSRAAGYLDKRIEEHNFNFNFTNRGDGELIAELQNMMPGVDVAKIIDGEFDDITQETVSEQTCLTEIPAETFPIEGLRDINGQGDLSETPAETPNLPDGHRYETQ